MDGSEHICPISRETGVQPRRSIDVAAGLPPPPQQQQQRAGGQITAAADAAAAATTAAAPLTADGRLSLPHMMLEGPRSGKGEASSSLLRSATMSRSPAHAAAPPAARATTTWHASAAWANAGRQPGGDAASQAPGPSDAALAADVQQLASACRTRNAKLLQQLLARGVSTTHALDADGNTALHLVLLPHDACAATGGGSRGPFAWVAGCFGVPAAAAGADGVSRSGSSSSRALSPAAATAAQLGMVTALLGACAGVNVRNKAGATPLMLAAQQVVCSSMGGGASASSQVAGALRVLEVLCKGVMTEPNVKDAAGRTALVLVLQPAAALCAAGGSGSAAAPAGATSKQQRSTQQVVVSCGGSAAHSSASSSASLGRQSCRDAAAGAASPALAAAQLRAVELLLHAGADCNAADARGMTPLMHAAAQPWAAKEVLQLLLERGANARQLDNSRRSVLTHAIVAHGLQATPALGLDPRLAQAACPACCGSRSSAGGRIKVARPPPAAQAAAAGRQHAAGLPDAAARAGSSSGSGSSGGGVGDSAGSSTLDAAGLATAGAKDAAGCWAAASCAYCGGGASSAGAGAAGGGSLHRSSHPGPPNPAHSGVVRALCSYGALDLFPGSINTRFPGLNGFTQLHIAMRRGDVAALQLLLASGADVNATDSWGNSPLMYWPVTPREPEELVEELVGRLLSHGADPNLPNHDGWTPLDMACDLNKLGKVVVKPQCVPVHALLVGWGAQNSSAFKLQYRNPPQLLCMRTDSANSFIRNSKGFGSLRAMSTQELASQVAALREEDGSV